MRNVKGFRIIEIPLGEGIEGYHYIYIKEHSGSKASKDSTGKVLFVGNVEYRINMTNEAIDEYLRALFERFGDVVNIHVSVLPPDSTATSKCAHVEFAKKSAMKLALSSSDDDYRRAADEVCEQFGVVIRKKSAVDVKKMFPFADCDPVILQEEVDQFMAEYDEKESILRREREERLNQVDEDGFMPVKNRNKRKRSLEGTIPGMGGGADDFEGLEQDREASVHRRAGAPRSRKAKAKKQTELKGFYRFQIKEEKMKDLETLRKKFAEDKDRVAKMKEQRKFKPF